MGTTKKLYFNVEKTEINEKEVGNGPFKKNHNTNIMQD